MQLHPKNAAIGAGVGVCLLLASSWWYFGGADAGAFVTNSGVGAANGVYSWLRPDLLVQNPVSVATNGNTKLPTLVEMLVTSVDARSGAAPLSVLQRHESNAGVAWLLGSKSKLFYSATVYGQGLLPPETGWSTENGGKPPMPQLYLRGSRPSDLGSAPSGQRSKFWDSPFMTTIRTQPVNCAIILVCVRIWFLLRSRRWGWPDVGSSYRNVMYDGQVWRLITASFSHVDLMHLAMNMISLYQVGWLEQRYGSLLYGVFSMVLVVLTMVVGLLIYHVLITRYGKQHYIETIGVGYSCVLFSWIVVATSLTPKYCPIPGLDSVCFPTWKIPLVVTSTKLPFNAAPFALLLAMHYIVPKSSFIGHLAGIVMGYPLLWNGMNWFGVAALARFSALAIIGRSVWAARRQAALVATMTSGSAAPPLPTTVSGIVAPAGTRNRTLFLTAAATCVAALVSFPSATWGTAVSDLSAAGLALLAWVASAGFDAQGGVTGVPADALLACAGVAATDILTVLLRVGVLLSSSGGWLAWTSGMVPIGFVVAMVAMVTMVAVNSVAVLNMLKVVQSGQTSSPTGALWYLPVAATPSIGAQPTSVVRNGVLLSREQERAARLAAIARGGMSPEDEAGRRLGTV